MRFVARCNEGMMALAAGVRLAQGDWAWAVMYLCLWGLLVGIDSVARRA